MTALLLTYPPEKVMHGKSQSKRSLLTSSCSSIAYPKIARLNESTVQNLIKGTEPAFRRVMPKPRFFGYFSLFSAGALLPCLVPMENDLSQSKG
jgi:hypothetical protein